MRRYSLTRRGALLAAPAIILASALSRSVFAQDDPRWAAEFAPGELIVRLRAGVAVADLSPILARHHARIARSYAPLAPRDYAVVCPDGGEQALAVELESSGLVDFAHAAVIPSPAAVPNDTSYSDLPWPAMVNAPAVWDRFKLTDFSSMPPVIDIDTGVKGSYSGGVFTPNHPELTSAVITQVYNAENGTQDVTDASNHGTTVMGVMASITNNALGVSNVGWGGTGIAIKATTFAGQLAAFTWIAANITPPGFLCFPWNFGSWAGQTFEDSVVALNRSGFLLFGASGDLGTSTCRFGIGDIPAPYALCVAACDSLFRRCDYSNYGGPAHAGGIGANCCAPGGNTDVAPIDHFWSPNNTGNLSNVQGTSYSAPFACAVARFLKTVAPWLSTRHLYDIMTDQSLTTATTGFGASPLGCIDFDKMLDYVQAKAPPGIR